MTSLPGATARQSAVRLLACVNAGANEAPSKEDGPDIVAVLRSQTRLQALDFWMRNPDYLANELLNEYELHHDPALLLKAREIFESREPDLRRVPMVRYLFGAFEPLDEGLALLRTHDFVRIRRVGVPGAHIREHLYLVTKDGRTALDKLAAMGPELAWYRQRAVLVAQVAGGAGGKALKDRQYLQQEYAGTALKKVIAPITDRVRLRMEGLLSGVHP